MEPSNTHQQVWIFIGESDQWRGQPLHLALLSTLRHAGVAGATALRGLAGYGASSRIHTASLVELSGDLPIVVTFVDRTDRIAAVMPTIAAMVGEGLITALPVAQLGIPSFVASLAGWLIYRGFLQQVTEGTGTIIISNATFNALGNGFIPDIPGLGNVFEGVHKLTLLLGIVAIVLYVFSAISTRRKQQAYNFEVIPGDIFTLQLTFISILIGGVTWILASYQGLSWTVVIMLIVVGIYHFITTQTVLGRHIYAVGGNPDAAELSGISVKRIIYTVFGSMGLLSALSGILFAARLTSASPTAGTLFELDAIAAAYVGGVSAAGGVGRVTGSIIGALVMTSLINGMNLMGVGISYQYIVRGAVLAAAVIFDVATRRARR